MGERKVQTVVLGLGEDGRLLLEAASGVDDFHIVAVADKDAGLAEKVAEEYNCAAYDDYRQVITAMDARLGEDEDRCLLVGTQMHNCGEYVRTAMKRGFAVVKRGPAGRDFEEAAELVRLADEEGVEFVVANPARYAPSYVALRELIETGAIEEVFLVAGFCSFAGYTFGAWQSDPQLAGGGVLVHNGYKMVDQMMWNFALPQVVYSLTTNQAADKQQRLSLTEDTVVVTMKFSDRRLGNLIVSSRSSVWPRQEFVKICGKDKIIVVNDTRLTIRGGDGEISEEFQYEYDAVDCMRKVLKDFALAVFSPDEHEIHSSGRENLKSMAVIESVYLSSRTGMPEEPGRILQMGQIEPADLSDEF